MLKFFRKFKGLVTSRSVVQIMLTGVPGGVDMWNYYVIVLIFKLELSSLVAQGFYHCKQSSDNC